jgi:hypothetical protein
MAHPSRRREAPPEALTLCPVITAPARRYLLRVRGFFVCRACRRAGTDDAAAKQRRRRRAFGPALLGGATACGAGRLNPYRNFSQEQSHGSNVHDLSSVG